MRSNSMICTYASSKSERLCWERGHPARAPSIGLLGTGGSLSLTLRRAHLDEMFAHARAVAPAECCGLVGGQDERAETIYRLQNIAADPLTAYEGAPGELFAAQREM